MDAKKYFTPMANFDDQNAVGVMKTLVLTRHEGLVPTELLTLLKCHSTPIREVAGAIEELVSSPRYSDYSFSG